MIEEKLMEMGILGLWTLSLFIEKQYLIKKFKTAIENNSQELKLLRKVIGGIKWEKTTTRT